MTIPTHLRENTSRYAKTNGFVNLSFLTGTYFPSIPNQEPIKNVIWVLPTGITNLHHAMPVLLDPKNSVHITASTRPGDSIHLKCRLEAGIISTETRSVIPRALTIERPNVMNSKSGAMVSTVLSTLTTEQDDFSLPLSEDVIETMNPSAPQNNAKMGAFLSWKKLYETDSGRLCMAMLLMQNGEDGKAIHARMYASSDHAKTMLQQYFKMTPLMQPYFFVGNYRVNVKHVGEDSDKKPLLEKFGYFHVTNIHPHRPGDVPTPFPDWVNDHVNRMRQPVARPARNAPATPVAEETEGEAVE